MEQGRCLSLGLKVLGCKNPGLHRTKDKEFGRIGENGGCQELEGRGNGEMLVKAYKLPVMR